ncbi:MAG TPA: universal stress protein [Trichocoleus sp.]|jgi:nucleotide-binding universal stress UspA family protein
MFQKILVAIDRSDVSRQAFEQAIELAKKLDAQMMLVHVISPFNPGYPNPVFPGTDGIYPGGYTEAMETFRQEWDMVERNGNDLLQTWTKEAIEAGVKTESTQPMGDPGRAVCLLAEHWQADLIMLGRHGRKGLSELFFGSVSNFVMHHAPCSVLTVSMSRSAGVEAESLGMS